jgi:hypothetical protein
MLAKKILKTQTMTRVENVEMAKPEFREPWVLPNSIFKPRIKEADSKNFFDTEQVRSLRGCAGVGEGEAGWKWVWGCLNGWVCTRACVLCWA